MFAKVLLGLIVSTIAISAHAGLIAVSLPRYNDNFINVLYTNIEASIDATGHDVYIDQAEDSMDVQYRQIKHFTDHKVDAIIVILVNNSHEFSDKIAQLATKSQIPLVFLNVKPELEPLPSGTVFVGSNELESGTLQMEELARLSKQTGSVALLMGEKSHPAAQTRTLDVDTVLKKYPKMDVLIREHGNWERNQAFKIVTKWLKEKKGEFNIIVGNNDEMAIGAITALEEAGEDPKKYLIGGIDATADALKYMADGKLDVTVFQDAAGQATEAAKAAVALLSQQQVSKTIWVPFKLVTPRNMHQFTR